MARIKVLQNWWAIFSKGRAGPFSGDNHFETQPNVNLLSSIVILELSVNMEHDWYSQNFMKLDLNLFHCPGPIQTHRLVSDSAPGL